jgi:Hemerythrin HHE cation binding domain
VKQELQVHEAIEEEIFYPALKEHPKAKDLVLEAYEEHNVVDMVMSEIDGVAFDDERWGAKLTVMKENVEHHIEEEESEMFKQARDVFNHQELEDLGERMEIRKKELM